MSNHFGKNNKKIEIKIIGHFKFFFLSFFPWKSLEGGDVGGLQICSKYIFCIAKKRLMSCAKIMPKKKGIKKKKENENVMYGPLFFSKE